MLVQSGTKIRYMKVRGRVDLLFHIEIVVHPWVCCCGRKRVTKLHVWTGSMDDGSGRPDHLFPRGIVAAAFYMKGLTCLVSNIAIRPHAPRHDPSVLDRF